VSGGVTHPRRALRLHLRQAPVTCPKARKEVRSGGDEKICFQESLPKKNGTLNWPHNQADATSLHVMANFSQRQCGGVSASCHSPRQLDLEVKAQKGVAKSGNYERCSVIWKLPMTFKSR